MLSFAAMSGNPASKNTDKPNTGPLGREMQRHVSWRPATLINYKEDF